MSFVVNLCKCSSILNPTLPLSNSSSAIKHSTASQFPATTPKPYSASSSYLTLSSSSSVRRLIQVAFCSNNEAIEASTSTHLPAKRKSDDIGLLNKPSPKPIGDQSENETQKESEKRSKDEILEPFRRLFTPIESLDEKSVSGVGIKKDEQVIEERNQVRVEYFEPKPGDFVLGVVVSGNDKKLDVNVGADLLGVMLTKDVLPLDSKEMGHLLCDLEKDAERAMVGGKVRILKNDVAFSGEAKPTQPVVDPGTVLFAEVLGRTLSGWPLLSSRKLFRRIAWHRVRQIKHLNEPIEVKVTEWNMGGLLTRIEGLRAFLPKAELMNRVKGFTELKENVGRRMHVLITRMNEETNELVLTEKEAWNMLNLQEGTLLEGTVLKIFPYGAQVGIGETNRSGLLHISNITKGHVSSVGDLLAVNEKIKALVVKSLIPDKISLSTAALESEPGLFLLNKEKVFSEAEEMAKKYRERNISPAAAAAAAAAAASVTTTDTLPFEDEERMYANWQWFKFEKGQPQ